MAVDVVGQSQAEYNSRLAEREADRDRATTTSKMGIDGNAYTDSVSNDKLTNNDFLRLMLEEMKMQDPTKPMDSASLMDSQLKMSTIESNQGMADSMAKLQASYAASALTTAANIVGHVVQNGQKNDKGELKAFKVVTVDNKNGEISMHVKERTGIADILKYTDKDENGSYNTQTGVIYEDGEATEYSLSLDTEGRFTYNDDKSIKIVDKDNAVVTDEAITGKFKHGGYAYTYADAIEIPLSSVTTIS